MDDNNITIDEFKIFVGNIKEFGIKKEYDEMEIEGIYINNIRVSSDNTNNRLEEE